VRRVGPLFGGCHFNRATAATIRVNGFVIDELNPLRVGGVSHIHIHGRAHRA
jgi:hypothetical protein